MEETRKLGKKEREEDRGSAQKTRSPHSKFKKWFLASTAATALIIGLSCGDHNETYIPIPPGNEQVEGDGGNSADGGMNTDSGPDLDADVDTDSGTDLDGGPDLDADVDADTDSGTDLDGGPDLDADVDADTDSGTDLDGGPDLDADVDADTDSGTDLDGGPDLDADVDADTDSGTDLDGGPDLDADVDSGTYTPCSGVYNDADYGVPIYSSPGHDTGGYLFYYDSYDAVTGDITVDIMCGSETVRSDVLVLAGTIQVLDIPEDGKRVSITNVSSGATVANVNLVVEDIPSSGSDGGVDGGISDAGPGPDGGVITPACTGVTNSATYGYLLYSGYSVSVGGYTVTNNGAVTGGIEVNIDCGSDSASVVPSLYLPEGISEVVYGVPADGKRIRLHNHSNSALVSNISIVVENL